VSRVREQQIYLFFVFCLLAIHGATDPITNEYYILGVDRTSGTHMGATFSYISVYNPVNVTLTVNFTDLETEFSTSEVLQGNEAKGWKISEICPSCTDAAPFALKVMGSTKFALSYREKIREVSPQGTLVDYIELTPTSKMDTKYYFIGWGSSDDFIRVFNPHEKEIVVTLSTREPSTKDCNITVPSKFAVNINIADYCHAHGYYGWTQEFNQFIIEAKSMKKCDGKPAEVVLMYVDGLDTADGFSTMAVQTELSRKYYYPGQCAFNEFITVSNPSPTRTAWVKFYCNGRRIRNIKRGVREPGVYVYSSKIKLKPKATAFINIGKQKGGDIVATLGVKGCDQGNNRHVYTLKVYSNIKLVARVDREYEKEGEGKKSKKCRKDGYIQGLSTIVPLYKFFNTMYVPRTKNATWVDMADPLDPDITNDYIRVFCYNTTKILVYNETHPNIPMKKYRCRKRRSFQVKVSDIYGVNQKPEGYTLRFSTPHYEERFSLVYEDESDMIMSVPRGEDIPPIPEFPPYMLPMLVPALLVFTKMIVKRKKIAQ
jgi:hypothetical protein